MSEFELRRRQQAFRLAATGAAAFAYRIEIVELRLPAEASQPVARLAPLDQEILAASSLSQQQQARVEDYVTTLLADSVGRLLWQERDREEQGWFLSNAVLRRRRISAVLAAQTPHTDRALALVVALLQPEHLVHALAKLEGFWRRANRLLRVPPHGLRRQVLVDRLLAVDALSGSDVIGLCSSIVD